jgi:hypothetical protein
LKATHQVNYSPNSIGHIDIAAKIFSSQPLIRTILLLLENWQELETYSTTEQATPKIYEVIIDLSIWALYS